MGHPLEMGLTVGPSQGRIWVQPGPAHRPVVLLTDTAHSWPVSGGGSVRVSLGA